MNKIKNQVIAIWSRRFEEVLEEKTKCPKCGMKSLVRHIKKEPEEKWAQQWHVEYCTHDECPYWNCGFLPKKYKSNKEGYKWIQEVPEKVKRQPLSNDSQ